ncbi:MAG: putative toxin-antitoxin system toxin component, PIN family [Burkholderiales bacterium]|nr:putative toxin-antitoxin system toxin component, PIN family [Burkholderiales bacterium]
MRLVLDTNVWLDWLVFDNPEVVPLREAVAAGASIVIDTACLAELERALAYPLGRWTLTAAGQAAALTACDALTDGARPPNAANAAQGSPKLPTCRDPDDQKFLELARDRRADVLVTRDRALLELARPRRAALPFRIVTPRQFAASGA